MHRTPIVTNHRRGRIRQWLACAAAITGLVLLLGWLQADDDAKAAEAEAFERGYQAGLRQAEATAADAYRIGWRDRGQQP